MLIMKPLAIDTRSAVPSYTQLADQLRAAIESGEIAADDPLPSITRIRQETGLAVGTIRHAIDVLTTEGWAYTVPGRGTFASGEEES
jgi:DNA-binding GntR family transcriptional regulator